jgi:hypothetical protein
MNRRRLPTALFAAAVLLAACGLSKIHAGSRHALLVDQVNSTSANVRVGQQFSYAVVLLRSTSGSPVTIRKVTLTEPKGIGDVVKPIEVDVAHLARRDDWPVRNWSSFPPTAKIDGTCQAMQLEPAVGAVIPPHQAARLVVLFKALKTGDYFLDGQDVAYTVNGTPDSVSLPNRFLGTVTKTGGDLTPTSIEKSCSKLGNLPPG